MEEVPQHDEQERGLPPCTWDHEQQGVRDERPDQRRFHHGDLAPLKSEEESVGHDHAGNPGQHGQAHVERHEVLGHGEEAGEIVVDVVLDEVGLQRRLQPAAVFLDDEHGERDDDPLAVAEHGPDIVPDPGLARLAVSFIPGIRPFPRPGKTAEQRHHADEGQQADGVGKTYLESAGETCRRLPAGGRAARCRPSRESLPPWPCRIATIVVPTVPPCRRSSFRQGRNRMLTTV